MRIDSGKSAKNLGNTRPRDARRADQSPPKATRKAVKKPKVAKPFGISYESNDLCFVDGKIASRWRPHEYWYETRERRDQALKSFRHRYRTDRFYRGHQPIDRADLLNGVDDGKG